MSDTPTSPGPTPHGEQELEVDLAAFLPEADEADDVPVEVVDGDPVAAPVEVPEVEVQPEPAGEPAASEAPSRPGPDLSALEQIETDLNAVDAALAALDGGTYGRCAACDQPIGDDLLEVEPTRTACLAHS